MTIDDWIDITTVQDAAMAREHQLSVSTNKRRWRRRFMGTDGSAFWGEWNYGFEPFEEVKSERP